MTKDTRYFWQGEIARTIWHCPVYRRDSTDDGRFQVDNLDDGELISSLTPNGLHAPALDLDFQCGFLPDDAGGGRLTIQLEQAVDEGAWRRLLAVCLDLKLVSQAFAANADAGLFPSEPNVCEIDFCVPVMKHRSSNQTHSHVYLGVELAWDDYHRLLVAMRDAGLLTERSVGFARQRQATMLFKPGFHKPHLRVRPGVEIENGWGSS